MQRNISECASSNIAQHDMIHHNQLSQSRLWEVKAIGLQAVSNLLAPVGCLWLASSVLSPVALLRHKILHYTSVMVAWVKADLISSINLTMHITFISVQYCNVLALEIMCKRTQVSNTLHTLQRTVRTTSMLFICLLHCPQQPVTVLISETSDLIDWLLDSATDPVFNNIHQCWAQPHFKSWGPRYRRHHASNNTWDAEVSTVKTTGMYCTEF